MLITTRSWFWLPGVALCALFLLSSCGAPLPLPTDEQRQEARSQISCLVVLPVQAEVNGDQDMTYQEAAILEEGASYMDKQLVEQLNGRNNVRVLSSRQLTSLLPQSSVAQLALFQKVGSELNCNAVMATTLSRYKQRVGSSYGVDSPASVTFSMKLYDTGDGSVLWSGMFQETQQSFLSNILSPNNRGLTWLTVEELVSLGIKEKIKECPYL